MTPKKLAWYPTSHTKIGETRIGVAPLHEFSGEIAEAGEGAGGWSIGQEVRHE